MDGNIPHILLVEDEQSHAELIRRAFESQAGQVELTVASCLREARARIAEVPPDLVIADLRLPDGAGLDLLPAEGEEAHLPVVVLTAQGDEPTAVEAMKRGALDYVVKSESALADAPHIAQRALREWHQILQRRRAEEAVRESQSRLALAIECTGCGLWDQDFRTGRVTRSDNWMTMLGYEPGEIGQDLSSWKELIHPDDRARTEECAREHEAGLTDAFSVEHRMRAKCGQWKWIKNWGRIVQRDQHGNPVRALGLHLDVTERKRAEEEVREERDRSQQYLATAQVMIVVIGADEKVSLVNQKGSRVLGYPEAEIIGANWFDTFLPERARNEVRAVFRRLLYGDAAPPEWYENPVLTKRGEERIILWHNAVLRDETGKITAALSSGEDITQRKRAEEAYRSLVDHSLQGLVIFQDGRVVFANRAMAEITGYAVEEMLALAPEQVEAFVHPQDRDLVWGRHRDRLNGEPLPERYEFRGIRKDGSVCWLELHAKRIEYQGKPAVQAAYVDVTARREAEQALRESEEKYRLVSENVPVVVYSALPDEHSTNLFVSGRVEGLSGYSGKQFLEDPTLWDRILHSEDRVHVWQAVQQHRRDKGPLEVEYRIVTKDGQVRWIRDHATPMLDDRGEVSRIDGFMEDITQRKRAEEELRRTEAQLAHVGRLSALGEMVAGIAHEVNQPLYSVVNFAKASRNVLAAEGPPNLDDLRRWNDEIAAAAARAGDILRELGNFARKAEPRYTRAGIAELIDEAVKLVAFEARGRQVAVDLELGEAAVPVDLHRVQIQQVLVNLLRNAYEALEHADLGMRRVTISTRAAGRFVQVSVADSGPGLSPDQQLRMFEPFVTTKPDGLGMGLAISKTIVEAHGGTLWASSNPGGGAVFHFTLPVGTRGRTHAE